VPSEQTRGPGVFLDDIVPDFSYEVKELLARQTDGIGGVGVRQCNRRTPTPPLPTPSLWRARKEFGD